MNSTFSPRRAGPEAWKVWFKDSTRILGRIGPVRIAILGGFFYLVAMKISGLASTAYSPLILLSPVPGALGVLYFREMVHQAAEGHRISLVGSIALTWQRIREQPRWVIGFAIRSVLVCLFAFLVLFLVSGPSSPQEPLGTFSQNQLAALLLINITLAPLCGSNWALISFSYWLGFLRGMDAATSGKQQIEAVSKNLRSVSRCLFFFFAISFMISLFVPSGSPLAFPLVAFSLLHAGILECAYRDIFEGGAGLKEMQRQYVREGMANAVPVSVSTPRG